MNERSVFLTTNYETFVLNGLNGLINYKCSEELFWPTIVTIHNQDLLRFDRSDRWMGGQCSFTNKVIEPFVLRGEARKHSLLEGMMVQHDGNVAVVGK